MDIQSLEALIDKIADKRNVQKTELINELADILKLKYDITLMDKERAIVDEVKNKIVTRLYNTEHHSINRSDHDEVKHYKLDALETRFLDTALEEMLLEGLITHEKNTTALTDAGILKYKEFYGEV